MNTVTHSQSAEDNTRGNYLELRLYNSSLKKLLFHETDLTTAPPSSEAETPQIGTEQNGN